MADWFKFYNDGLDSKGMQFAISEQPLVTSVWLVIMSEASKNRAAKFKWGDLDFELIGFARKVNVSVPIFNQSLGLLERIGYIKRTNGHIEVSGWEKMQSDYARGKDRGYYKKTSKTLASNSLDTSARREERRVEEKRDRESLSLPVELPHGFPKTEKEAESQADFVGCPKKFSVTVWNKAMGRHGRDAKDVPIRSFRHHLKTEWTYEEQRQSTEKPQQNGF